MYREELIEAIVEAHMDETMQTLQSTGRRVGRDISKFLKREIVKPYDSIERARRYKVGANRASAQGRVVRAAEMHSRANKVLRRQTPKLAGAMAGAAFGPVTPPGVGAALTVAGSKAGDALGRYLDK